MSLNIDGSTDPMYRYKMPKISVTVLESKGGITQVSNTEAIAHAIYRTPEQLRAHFSFDLKSAVRVVTSGNGVSVLQFPGKLSSESLQSSLFKYIKNNVLCSTCQCPETTLTVDKITCSACGTIRRVQK